MKYVPVISSDGKPLMPTSPSRARKFIKSKDATPFFNLGVFCIRLNRDSGQEKQLLCLGNDPGSKKGAMTVRSKAHTYLNLQRDEITYVKDNIEARREMRRSRRFRKTPYRKPRWANRSNSRRKDRVPPSTLARRQYQLNLVKKLAKVFPIAIYREEDIASRTYKGIDKRNKSFGPLQAGKKYIRKQISNLGIKFVASPGYHTKKLRNLYKLDKTKNKMSEKFEAHCVDSWAMATEQVGGKKAVDNKEILYIEPMACAGNGLRRSLHKRQFSKGKIRKRSGGTRSLGFTKGCIVKLLKPTKTTLKFSPKSIFRVGGYDSDTNKISIYTLDGLGNKDSGRVSRNIDSKNLKLLSYNRYKIRYNNF